MNIPHDFWQIRITWSVQDSETELKWPAHILQNSQIGGFHKCKISSKGKKQVSKKKDKNFFSVLQDTVEHTKSIKYCKKKKSNRHLFCCKCSLVVEFFRGVGFSFILTIKSAAIVVHK